MVIKDILQKQDGGFISLHDLLKKMAAVHGDTLQDAATVLLRLLNQRDNSPGSESLYPNWYEFSRERGPLAIKQGWEPIEALRYVVVNGQWMDSNDLPF
jgi:hypothetical protein